MAATTAKTRQDVEKQSARERLWDSLNYTYGQRGEELAQNYNQAISQSNNAMLKRGMQRSSYGAQINANLLHQKNKALAGNTSEMIAAYQDRLGQIEQQEQEQANWEKTFAENQRQFNEQMGETKAQNEFTRNYQTNAFNYQKERDAVSDKQWQDTFDYNKGRDAVSDAQWEKNYNTQNEQWDKSFGLQKEQFAYTQSNDERNYYASWVQSIAANGGEASDDMLAKAGLSRSDFEAMKAQAAATGGGGGGGGGSYSPKTTPAVTDDDFLNGLNGNSMLSALNSLRNNTYTPKSDKLLGQGKNDSIKNAKANDSATSASALKKEQNSLRKK